MPTVKAYGQRQVGTAKLPGARRTAPNTPESYGGGLASTIGRAALEVRREELEAADAVTNLTTLRQLNDLDHQVLRSEDKGILNKRGLEVMEARASTLEAFDTQAGEIQTTLRTDRQRLFFEQQRVNRRAQVVDAIDRHGVAETRAHDTGEVKAFVVSSQQRAIDADTPQLLSAALGEQTTAIRDYAARNKIGPEATAVMIATARNETWDGVITRQLVGGHDRVAQVYFDEARDAGQLTGETLTKMAAAVKQGSADGEGERAAADIWQQGGPASDTDPIHLDRMETAARARFPDDALALKATISALRSRKQGVDAARADRLEATNSTVWGAVVRGTSLAEVKRLPEFIRAPGQVQLQVRDYFTREGEHRENRAYTTEQRAYTAEARKDRELEMTGWSAYWEAAQPDALSTLTPGAIMAKLPALGTAHVDRLLKAKAQLDKDEATYRAAVIDADLFKDVVRSALPYVDKPTTLEQKGNIGKLQALVEDQIARAQQGARRKLTRDETRGLMQAIVDQKVVVEDAGWFYRDTTSIAAMVAPEDRSRAYVPIDQVPDAAVEAYTNYLRGELPALARLPTAEIKARYGDRIQRAYALRLLRGTRAEIDAALKGTP